MMGPRPNRTKGRHSQAEPSTMVLQSNLAYSLQDQEYTVGLLDHDRLHEARGSIDEDSNEAHELDSTRHRPAPLAFQSPYSSNLSSASGQTFAPLLYSGGMLSAKSDGTLIGKGLTPSPSPTFRANGHDEFDADTYLMPSFRLSSGHAYAAVPRSARLLSQETDGFERPRWVPLALFVLLCVIAHPFLVLVALIARDRSLFWARAIVGVGVRILGFCMAFILLMFARCYLEASTWATVIHASRNAGGHGEGPGVLLRDLAWYTSEPTSIYAALNLLKDRWRGGNTRHAMRGSYDRRPWTFFILFFLLLVCLSSSLSFIYGRIVSIEAATRQQANEYNKVYVWGDLSSADLSGAANLSSAFQTFMQTWTLTPFASLTSLPSAVSFTYENDTVYFAESYAHQLREDGQGLGTYNLSTFTSDADGAESVASVDDSSKSEDEQVGLVQFPKWGIRIYCEKLPEPETYLIPMSPNNFTYIFVPDFFLRELFANLSLPFPDLPSANLTNVLMPNDTAPDGVNVSSIVVGAGFYSNGVAHSFKSSPTDMGASGNGWVEIEMLSVRLNSTYTPNGTFPVRGPLLDQSGADTYIGYDAAVCIEAYEPWIVETYNTTGVPPSSTRIVRRAHGNDSQVDPNVQVRETDGKRRHAVGMSETGVPEVQWTLNSTGKATAFSVAHDNSVNQMVKDNGRDFWWVPSPLLVSFTGGSGPTGYTSLSATHYARARAAADATNVLPFLAGSGALAARFYPSRIVSVVYVQTVPFLITTCALLAVGLAAGLCIPRLPLAVPHRGFDLFSWLAVLYGDNMIGQLPILPGDRSGIYEKMDLEEIERRFGDVRVRYHA